MANTSERKSGGFGLGPVVVVGAICFALGYGAAIFVPVLKSSKATGTHAPTRVDRPRVEEDAGRDRVPDEPEMTEEAKKAAEEAAKTPATPEPSKAPTP